MLKGSYDEALQLLLKCERNFSLQQTQLVTQRDLKTSEDRLKMMKTKFKTLNLIANCLN